MTEITLQPGEYVAKVEQKAIHRVLLKDRPGLPFALIHLTTWAFNTVEDEHDGGPRPQGAPWYFTVADDLLRVFPTPKETTTLVLLSTDGD